MKKLLGVIGVLIFLISYTTSPLFGQAEEANYLKFDYVKVAPDQVQDYMEYMSTTWKPLYQKRVDAGRISSWSLYRVAYPGGARGDYNFVVITAAPSLSHFETMRPMELLAQENQSRAQIRSMMTKANGLRTIMFSELWNVINKVAVDQPSPHSSKYVMLDYMLVTPGRDFDYQMLEDEFAKPIHVERISQNRMQGWEVYSLVSPGGTKYGYNFATGNFFNNLNNVETGFTEDVVENAIPGTDVPELMDTILSTRDLVKSEVWELVDKTQ